MWELVARGCNEEQGELCGNKCPTLLYLRSYHPGGCPVSTISCFSTTTILHCWMQRLLCKERTLSDGEEGDKESTAHLDLFEEEKQPPQIEKLLRSHAFLLRIL